MNGEGNVRLRAAGILLKPAKIVKHDLLNVECSVVKGKGEGNSVSALCRTWDKRRCARD